MSTAERIERLTGRTVVAEHGGHPPRFDLDDGSGPVPVVLKDAGSEAGAVPAEAAGLRWLAVPGGPPVPEVLGSDEQLLVSTHVPPGRPSVDGAAALGRRLATLHAAGADAFGAPPPGGPANAWIGHARMRNHPHPGPWADWFAADRIEPYLRTARDRGALSAGDAATIGRVTARIGGLAGPDEPPARLHGDLWSGNVLWSTGGTAWLIDPAAHGGHRESDLAMLHLFGLPHLDTVLAAYDETAPLGDGWADRIALHQLFPLLVHTVLFGGGYAGRTVERARGLL